MRCNTTKVDFNQYHWLQILYYVQLLLETRSDNKFSSQHFVEIAQLDFEAGGGKLKKTKIGREQPLSKRFFCSGPIFVVRRWGAAMYINHPHHLRRDDRQCGLEIFVKCSLLGSIESLTSDASLAPFTGLYLSEVWAYLTFQTHPALIPWLISVDVLRLRLE